MKGLKKKTKGNKNILFLLSAVFFIVAFVSLCIFMKFNIDRPADFTGHSLSKSDIVVINQDGKKTAHYVDAWGFQEVKGFVKTQKQTERRGRTL